MKNRMLVIVLACAAIMMSAAPQTPPRDPNVWTLEYRVGGGKAGVDRHLGLSQSGELVVGNFESSAGYGSHVASHASPELMAKVTEFLKIARKAPSTSGTPIPDAMYIPSTHHGSVLAGYLPVFLVLVHRAFASFLYADTFA
jgi:hypothetical protein